MYATNVCVCVCIFACRRVVLEIEACHLPFSKQSMNMANQNFVGPVFWPTITLFFWVWELRLNYCSQVPLCCHCAARSHCTLWMLCIMYIAEMTNQLSNYLRNIRNCGSAICPSKDQSLCLPLVVPCVMFIPCTHDLHNIVSVAIVASKSCSIWWAQLCVLLYVLHCKVHTYICVHIMYIRTRCLLLVYTACLNIPGQVCMCP
jgi:hypothetical protein